MKANIAIVIAIVAVIIAVYSVGSTVEAPSFGGTTNYDDLTLKANPAATTTLTLQAGSATQGGCIEIQPTSTATTLSSRISLLGATSTFAATAYYAYGPCR